MLLSCHPLWRLLLTQEDGLRMWWRCLLMWFALRGMCWSHLGDCTSIHPLRGRGISEERTRALASQEASAISSQLLRGWMCLYVCVCVCFLQLSSAGRMIMTRKVTSFHLYSSAGFYIFKSQCWDDMLSPMWKLRMKVNMHPSACDEFFFLFCSGLSLYISRHCTKWMAGLFSFCPGGGFGYKDVSVPLTPAT